MVRGLAQHLRPLLVGGNSFAVGQAFAQYGVPAVAVPSSGGLFGGKRVTTPLSEPLPNVNLPNTASPKKPELQVRVRVSVRAHALEGQPAAAAAAQAALTPAATAFPLGVGWLVSSRAYTTRQQQQQAPYSIICCLPAFPSTAAAASCGPRRAHLGV